MPSKLTVTVTMRQRRKALVWLYAKTLALLARLKVVDEKAAMQKAGQKMADSFDYRIGKGEWRRLNLEVSIDN